MRDMREQKDGYVQVWEVDPPAAGTDYRVIRESWNWDVEPAVRTIYEWEPAAPDLDEKRTIFRFIRSADRYVARHKGKRPEH